MDLKRNIIENGDKNLLAFYKLATSLEPSCDFYQFNAETIFEKSGSVWKNYTLLGVSADKKTLIKVSTEMIQGKGRCIVVSSHNSDTNQCSEKVMWYGLFNWVGLTNLAECEIKNFNENKK